MPPFREAYLVLFDIVATRAHVGERLVRSLTNSPRAQTPSPSAALAPFTLAWPEFISRLCLECLPEVSVCPRSIERVTLAAVLDTEFHHDPAFREPGATLDAFAQALDTLRSVCALPDDVTHASELSLTPDAASRERLITLARVFAAHETRLAAMKFSPAASIEARLADAIDSLRQAKVYPNSLGLPSDLRLWHMASLPAPRVKLIIALSRWLASDNGHVEVQIVCEPRRVRLAPALDRALRDLEACTDNGPELRYSLRDPGAPPVSQALSRWITTLSEGARSTDSFTVTDTPHPAVRLAHCHGPEEESRWVADCISRWLSAGISPHEISVVFPVCAPEVITSVSRALDDAKIPWSTAITPPVSISPVARAIVNLPRLIARSAERREVFDTLALLRGNASHSGEPEPWRLDEALCRLGIDSLFDPALEDRLRAATRLSHRRALSPAVTDALIALSRELWTLSLDATVTEHTTRLHRWLTRLGVDTRFSDETRATSAMSDSADQTIARALARDQAGVTAVLSALTDLRAAARTLDLDRTMSTGDFAELFADYCRDRPLRLPFLPASPGGIELLSLEDSIGRCFSAVVVPGLWDGNSPRLHGDALVGDPERLCLARSLKRLVPPPHDREATTLAFLSAISTATLAFAASTTLHDSAGRARSPSPFFADLQRTSGATIEHITTDPLARSLTLPPRGPERTLRALATHSLPRDMAPTGLASLLRSTEERAMIERSRQRHFASPHSTGDAYNGRIDHDLSLVSALELSRFGDITEPIDTTTLERAARCAYKAFALRVLRIEERDDPRDTLDPKQRGHLLHSLLEAGQEALDAHRDASHSTRWSAVHAALDEAGARYSLEVPRLDPALLDADLRAIRARVEAWISRRMNSPSAWRMVTTEEAFGPGRKWPALVIAVDSGPAVVLHGRIDGVERIENSLRVLEFKSGRGDGYRRRLSDGALDTQFQLIVYTAAVESARRSGALDLDDAQTLTVDGRYVGFRDLGEHSLRDTLSDTKRLRTPYPIGDAGELLTEATQGKGPLADAVRRVVLPLRQGFFAPQPRDCKFCQYRSLCRVELHNIFDNDTDDSGELSDNHGEAIVARENNRDRV